MEQYLGYVGFYCWIQSSLFSFSLVQVQKDEEIDLFLIFWQLLFLLSVFVEISLFSYFMAVNYCHYVKIYEKKNTSKSMLIRDSIDLIY